MQVKQPLITITQYNMTTARGIILQSKSFNSFEKALQFPSLCARTQSIVIKNNKTGADSVFALDFTDPHGQLEQELKEVFPGEFKGR